MEDAIITFTIFSFISCAFFSCFVASQKNRSLAGWFFAGLFFGFIALIAIAGSPIKEKISKTSELIDNLLK